jgi:hypothetical protein
MSAIIDKIIICCLVLGCFSCKRPVQNIPHYTISKVLKSDSATTLNVHISSRLAEAQLLSIASKVKSDSSRIADLQIHYLLPGNADLSAGDNSYYASAKYVKEGDVKSFDTLKDDNGNVFRIKVFGLSKDQAWHLLTMQPKEIVGKNVLGRFIDDYNHTMIIPFKDKADPKNEVYIIELDSTAKVVSATMPLIKKDDGVEKWLVTQNGDYMTLKNDVLTQFAADGLGVPFNSIKSGI